MSLFYVRSMNGSNFATPDNSGSVFPSSPAANYQVCHFKLKFETLLFSSLMT